ncbi:hypothetical protein [Myxococcus eversor]|uniref:hypothetical protein n=1 Tax=Myxococcus eversor TaxID=2709661 RepID=UPI0013D4D8DA|nr:hypothetical protein [Myxococcus eversor]
MTWMLQAAVVLGVVVALVGAVWAVVLGYRYAKAQRQAAASAAVEIYAGGQLGLTGFRGWLADLIDGDASEGCASSSEHSASMCEDTADD